MSNNSSNNASNKSDYKKHFIKRIDKKQRVKTAKGRKISSTQWIERHINDPYVIAANKLGYRSRSALKLMDIDNKYHLLKNCKNIILDLGSAPGGWLQVARKRSNAKIIIGVDISDIKPIEGTVFICGDFTDQVIYKKVYDAVLNNGLLDNAEITKNKCINNKGIISLILSDMSPSSCGDKEIDHIRIAELANKAIDFAEQNLNAGGSFVVKLFMGRKQDEIMRRLKNMFEVVEIFKPHASYCDSSEIFLVCLDFFVKNIDS